MKGNVELNHVWIPVQHHRNVPGREGTECASKHQTSSPYWTAVHYGFFVCFCNIFVFMVNGLEKSPSYHRLHISATDWDLLCCAREDGVLENRAFSPSSDWGYFSLLLVPAANGHGAMFKVTSESWPDLKKNFAKKLFLFYFLFWSQTSSLCQLTVKLHKYLCHIRNKSYGNNLKAKYFIFWSHNLQLCRKTDHWIEPVYK